MGRASDIVWDGINFFRPTRRAKEVFLQAVIKIFEDSVRELKKTNKVKPKQKKILEILRRIDKLESKTPNNLRVEAKYLIKILERYEEEINSCIPQSNIKLRRYFFYAFYLAFLGVIIVAGYKKDDLSAAHFLLLSRIVFLIIFLSLAPNILLSVLPRFHVKKTDEKLIIKKQDIDNLLIESAGKAEVAGILLGEKINGGYSIKEIRLTETLHETVYNLYSETSDVFNTWAYLLRSYKNALRIKKEPMPPLELDDKEAVDVIIKEFKLDYNELENFIGTFHTHIGSKAKRLHYGDYVASLGFSRLLKELSGSAIIAIFAKSERGYQAWVLLDDYKFGKLKIEVVD